jgi:hypothetical protein
MSPSLRCGADELGDGVKWQATARAITTKAIRKRLLRVITPTPFWTGCPSAQSGPFAEATCWLRHYWVGGARLPQATVVSALAAEA